MWGGRGRTLSVLHQRGGLILHLLLLHRCCYTAAPQAYKAKFRNLHFNLKDEKNPDLRRKVWAWCDRCHVL